MFEEQWTKKVIWLICLCVIEFYVTIEFFFCPIVPNSNGHIISYGITCTQLNLASHPMADKQTTDSVTSSLSK